MTTAYTSLLGLALPVTGELSGTWGDTVNNSITSLLDSAIAGTTTLSTDADVTLTTTTGAANTSREAILLCSGARTGIKTITAPAQSKIYTIINSTTGGYAVKIVGVGPTTGLTIPNGSSAVVAWNGSDFIEIGSATVGNFTVNGNLTVTGTSTLTGVATLTANPVLSAGTANGVTYLNGSKSLTSGTAITFDGTNFATTGTATATKLIPTGSSVTGNGLYLPAANALGLSTNGTNAVYIDSSQNVGIGTTSPKGKVTVLAPSSTTLGDEATSAVNIIGNNGTGKFWQINLGAYDTSFTYAPAAIGYVQTTSAGYNNGALVFATRNVVTDTAPTEAMRIDSSGNVGIGVTPNASLKLQVAAATNITLGIANATTITGAVTLEAVNNARSNNIPMELRATKFDFTGPTSGVSIDSSGNVGIGTTSPSSYGLLTVLSSTAGSAKISIQDTSGGASPAPLLQFGVNSSNGFNTADAARVWTTSPSSTTASLNFAAYSGGAPTTAQMTLTGGNVGIGTSSPGRKLDVSATTGLIGVTSSTGTNYVAYQALNTGGTMTLGLEGSSSIVFSGSTAYSAIFGTGGAYSLHLATNNTVRQTIDSSGNVGIGTTAPSSATNTNSVAIIPGSGQILYQHLNGTPSGSVYSYFIYNGSAIASISQNGTTGVLYNLTSDYRLKNNQQPLTGAKDFIMALQPKKWQWWDGSGDGVGFVAHEFMEVAKHSGVGEKDAVDADGKPVYQSIQPSSSEVIANLVAHIQNLETRLAALESK
jgi:hypothetical protein